MKDDKLESVRYMAQLQEQAAKRRTRQILSLVAALILLVVLASYYYQAVYLPSVAQANAMSEQIDSERGD